MSNDGHGYIGRLELADGSCVNVSLPDRQSKILSLGPDKKMVLRGYVLPYVHDDAFIEYRVNGRSVGFGLCGEKFVFVKG